MHDLTAASGSSLIASDQMNLAVFENGQARSRVVNGEPDMEALAQAISLMSSILGFYFLWHTACWGTGQCSRSLTTMFLEATWQDCFAICA